MQKISLRYFVPIFFLTIFMLFSCKDEKNEDLTSIVNKNGSVETAVTVERLDNLNDVLVTRHTIWFKGGKYNSVMYRDTIPSLNNENADRENNGVSEITPLRKEYEIFITVK